MVTAVTLAIGKNGTKIACFSQSAGTAHSAPPVSMESACPGHHRTRSGRRQSFKERDGGWVMVPIDVDMASANDQRCITPNNRHDSHTDGNPAEHRVVGHCIPALAMFHWTASDFWHKKTWKTGAKPESAKQQTDKRRRTARMMTHQQRGANEAAGGHEGMPATECGDLSEDSERVGASNTDHRTRHRAKLGEAGGQNNGAKPHQSNRLAQRIIPTSFRSWKALCNTLLGCALPVLPVAHHFLH